MKLKIEKTIVEEQEVEMPFYYRQDLYNSVLYGRVTEDSCLMVQESDVGYEIELKQEHPNNYTCYLEPGYASCEKEFIAALVRAQKWVASLL